jgi:hypothetical protein
MSPEQARGDSIDRRADIYSLGCIAYQMLIGEPPFTGGKVFDILTRHVDGTPEEAASRRPDLPAWLNRAVMRMLAKRPDERFITVYRLVEALRQGADSGLIMPDEIARKAETTPPPSVSLAMAKLGQRAASEEPVVEPATSQVETHRVGSSDVISSQPSPLAAKVAEAGGIGGRTALGVGLAGGLAAAVARGGAAAPAGQQGAFGKQMNRGNAPVTGPASGLSAAWFADGDAMEDGADLDESVRRRLERARAHAPSGTGILTAEVDRGESRRRWGLAAIIGVVVVGGAIAAVAMTGGGEVEKPSPAAAKEGPAPEAKAVTPPTPAPAAVEPTPPAAEPTPPAAEPTPPAAEPTPPAPERDKERVVIAAKSAPAGKKKKTASAATGGGRFESIGADPPDDQPADPAPKTAPDSGKADFYAKMGERDLSNGDLLGAATNFNKARELDANNATAVMGLGEIALSQGSTSAAIAHLKKAAKLRSGSSRAHALLGEAYLAAGQKSAAASSFKKALKIDPDNARARDGYNEASGANDPDPGQLE